MLTLDVFDDDAFSVTALVAAINQAHEGQHVPGMLNDLYDEGGIATLTAQIERQGDVLSLVPTRSRGAPGDVTTGPRRDLLTFACVHLPTTATISADEVQGVRAFGTTTEMQSLQQVVNGRLGKMRKRLDATIAYQRIGAVKGQILDADGSTPLLDVFHTFQVEQQVQGMGLLSQSTDVRQVAVTAKRMSEDALGDSAVIRGYRALCGRAFFDALVGHPNVKEAYQRWQAGEALRADLRAGFYFADIKWREYYGQVKGVPFLASDEAYLIPEGVDELFITRFGPANYIETVNTMGLPYYASQEIMRHRKGISLEAQSNPLTLCTRPRAIIKLTMADAASSGPSPVRTAMKLAAIPTHPTTLELEKTGEDDDPDDNDQANPSADKLLALLDGIQALVIEHNPKHFMRDGAPKADALEDAVKGFRVSAADRNYAWQIYQVGTSEPAAAPDEPTNVGPTTPTSAKVGPTQVPTEHKVTSKPGS